MCAALLLHEHFREAYDLQTGTLRSILGFQGRFDVVNHTSLLRKLYQDGINGSLWLLVKDSFEDAQSIVKWGNKGMERQN